MGYTLRETQRKGKTVMQGITLSHIILAISAVFAFGWVAVGLIWAWRDVQTRRYVRALTQLQHELDQLRRQLNEVMGERDEFATLFETRWAADMRAIKRWQAAGPDRELIWPDHADLCVWLLEQLPPAPEVTQHG